MVEGLSLSSVPSSWSGIYIGQAYCRFFDLRG
jgi:hypothetical protein